MFSSLSSKCLQIWINNAGTIRPLSSNFMKSTETAFQIWIRSSSVDARTGWTGILREDSWSWGYSCCWVRGQVLNLLFLSWVAFWQILISAWKTGQCLTHPHPGELHLVRYKIMLDCRLWSCISEQVPLYMVEAKSSKATQRFSREGTLPFWHIRCSVSIRCLGERWRMVVPPHLAYGDSGAGDSIPGWSNIWTQYTRSIWMDASLRT